MDKSTHSITWKCDYCGELIADHTGYIYIDADDLSRVRYDRNEWKRGVEGRPTYGSDLATYPLDVHWRVCHYQCQSMPDVEAYGVEIHRLRSYKHLLFWSLHFMGKQWLPYTNWDHFIMDRVPGVDA